MKDLRGNVRVNVRVRPFLSFDGPHGVSSIGVSCDNIVLLGKGDKGEDLHFPFDRTYGPTSSQEMLFNDVSEFVQSALDGYNVCLFSYGQTGSGKPSFLIDFYPIISVYFILQVSLLL